MQYLLSVLFIATLINAQSYKLNASSEDSGYRIDGMAVSNLAAAGDTLWMATDREVQRSVDAGLNWTTVQTGTNATPVKIFVDSRHWVWISYSIDSLIQDIRYQVGKGFAVYLPQQSTWRLLRQPLDDPVEFDSARIRIPVTTEINNITYDITETRNGDDRRIWIASFAGSLRYLNADSLTDPNWTPNWIVQTPTETVLDVAENSPTGFGQRAFSLTADSNRLWVGTANGIYASTNAGESFLNLQVGDGSNLSGNFITDLNFLNDRLIAMGLITFSGSDALNITVWNDSANVVFSHYFMGERVFDITTTVNGYLIAANSGLIYADSVFSETRRDVMFMDPITGLQTFDRSIFTVYTDGNIYLAGLNDGLIRSTNAGSTWSVFKSGRIPENVQQNNQALIYPSPFSPVHNDRPLAVTVRSNQGTVKVTVFDASMREQHQFTESVQSTGLHTLFWDGRNNSGAYLANGLYIAKIDIPGKTLWRKFVIVN